MFKKIIGIFLSIITVLSLGIPAMASEGLQSNYMTIDELNNYHNEIRTLQSLRSALQIARYETADNKINKQSFTSIDTLLNEIDEKLKDLGVKEVLPTELSFVTKDMSNTNNSIDLPVTMNERWELEEYENVLYNGESYDLYVLTAQSKNQNSELLDHNAKIIHAAPGIAAGTANYMRIAVTAGSGIVGTIAGTIYDAVSTILTSLSRITVIEDISATYSWLCDTIMHFVYLKPSGYSGEPILQYVYNEVNSSAVGVTASITFNSETYNNLGFKINDAQMLGVMEDNANDLGNAIDSYVTYHQLMHMFVEYVDIEGIGNKKVIRNYVCQYTMPGMIY